MKLFKRCKHQNTQTITNIFGDAINYFKGKRRIVNCIDCGKEVFKHDLDFKCKRTNQFYLKEFHMKADSINNISNGEYTFDELYYQRMILFATLCNKYRELSWKSRIDSDGSKKENHFLVGIKIGDEQYSCYFNQLDWDKFDIEWIHEVLPSIKIDSSNIDKLMKLSIENRILCVGDVFSFDDYRYILIHINNDKYIIRVCYPDSLEEYTVNKDWFNGKKYIETIELH